MFHLDSIYLISSIITVTGNGFTEDSIDLLTIHQFLSWSSLLRKILVSGFVVGSVETGEREFIEGRRLLDIRANICSDQHDHAGLGANHAIYKNPVLARTNHE
jgi:hypothetical protein